MLKLVRVWLSVVLSCSLIGFMSQESVAASYTITDLGVLPGDVGSRAYDINNNGLIVGYSYDYNGFAGTITRQAFSWSAGTGIQTISGSSVTESVAYAVNDGGQIVGSSNNKAFVFDGLSGFKYLGGLWAGVAGEAVDINNGGQITGYSYVTGGTPHAFLWENGTALDLGTLGGSSYATGINDQGQIVGYSKVADGAGFDVTHAFLFDKNGGMQGLGTFGGRASYAADINESSVAVGVVYNIGGLHSSFLFDGTGTVIDYIGTLGGDTWGYAINNTNQVVGSSYRLGMDQAFVWDDGLGIRNLNDLISDANWVLQYATGINDLGQIVGYGLHNGVARGFLLSAIAIPEPSSWVLLLTALAFGMLAILRTRQRL